MSASLDMDCMIKEEHCVTSMLEGHETTCWGCGLRVLVPPCTHIFKCGWCGAITNQNPQKHESERFQWRYFRDRCFVSILILFMLFIICGGVWAVYPVVFSTSFLCGAIHSVIIMILSVSTIASFSLAAFCSAGAPPSLLWGSYPVVGKGELENYTFCSYCSKPKSPRTHHCRSCQMCILDMDHHCPFIGNCVGAANHRCFVIFLISAIISTIYACVMSAYAGFHIWPPLASISLGNVTNSSIASGFKVGKEVILAFLNSAVLLSARDLVLVYLFVASFSVGIGLSILLWQQLWFIYEGKTYLSHISSQEENKMEERDCRNLIQFFGCPPSSTLRFGPIFPRNKKSHKK